VLLVAVSARHCRESQSLIIRIDCYPVLPRRLLLLESLVQKLGMGNWKQLHGLLAVLAPRLRRPVTHYKLEPPPDDH